MKSFEHETILHTDHDEYIILICLFSLTLGANTILNKSFDENLSVSTNSATRTSRLLFLLVLLIEQFISGRG